MLEITNYTVTSNKIPNSFEGYKILQLTDLHSASFGKDNAELIKIIDAIKPDIIVVTGDMMNFKNDDGQVFITLAAKLVKRYPVFCISGNHEQKIAQNASSSKIYYNFKKALEHEDVRFIDNKLIAIQKNNESINIYGLKLPLKYYKSLAEKKRRKINDPSADDINCYIGKVNSSEFNIMLMHTPQYFPAYANWGADITLCGHIHGGIIRIPFVGGLLSPDVTFFPKYDAGRFEKGDSVMIVGRGLGSSGAWKVRINNNPEIVVVTLKSKAS
jgi:predicted MPP superfamily phosphohydrolase